MGSIPFLKFFCLLVMGEERLTLGAKWELANSAFLDSGAGVMEFPSLHQVQALPATSSRLLAHHNLLPRALCMQAGDVRDFPSTSGKLLGSMNPSPVIIKNWKF